MEYILKYIIENPKYIQFFRNTLNCDEIFFQTIIMNFDYEFNVKNNYLRYIDWNSNLAGSPRYLKRMDIIKALNSNNVFARKVNSEEIWEFVRQRLEGSKN